MIDILLSIIPVFLLIMLGHILRRNGVPSRDFWNVNDRLVYWILLPALLFHNTSASAIAEGLAGPFVGAIVGAFIAVSMVALSMSKLAGHAAPVMTSVLQGSARHNTFIALAITERLYGAEGLALATLATAVLVPPTNVVMVSAMTVIHPRDKDHGLAGALIRDLARNPLILSVSLGLILNLAHGGRVPILHDVSEILGRAALPILLLAIGANLAVERIRVNLPPFFLATLLKMVLFPAAAVFIAVQLGVNGVPLLVAALYGSMPTATGAFTLSRQMGGDANLMATIISLQTLISLLTVPLTLGVVQALTPGG